MANAKIPLECIIILVALGLVVATIAAIIACFAFPMYFGIYLLYACVTGKFCRDGCKETMKQMFKNVVSITGSKMHFSITVICNT